jgi:RNA recognition motif-containing protein
MSAITIAGWFVDRTYSRCRFPRNWPPSLLRRSCRLGSERSPFLFGPESETAGRRSYAVENVKVAKRLYCGNLSYSVSSTELEQLFADFGSVVSAEVVSDRDSGRSKGFGFVEMSSDEEAQAAIGALNEKEVDGRPLTVNEAKPRESRGGGGGGGGGGRGRY